MQSHGRHEQHRGDYPSRGRSALTVALVVTVAFAFVELVGGMLTGSLALLADAGHMATDILALALSLFAAWVAAKPSSPRKTYGYYRAEILSALLNGAALVAIALWIVFEAFHRLANPPHIAAPGMMLVAGTGLCANLVSGAVLLRAGRDNLNVRAAFLHVAGDAIGALGALIAGAVILLTGFRQADPIASLVIAGLILFSSWRLLHESVDVLLEGTPHGVDLPELEDAMRAVPGVASVHDVHCWTVTSGFVAMSGHAELDGTCDEHGVLDSLIDTLTHRFHIAHVTIQPESMAHTADCCTLLCGPIARAPHGAADQDRNIH